MLNHSSTFITTLSENYNPTLSGELNADNNTIYFTPQTITGDGTTTLDLRRGNKINFTFGEQNETFVFTDPGGACNITIKLEQDAVAGGRTITWPGSITWLNDTAPTLLTATGATDIVTLYYDGSNYWGSYGAFV